MRWKMKPIKNEFHPDFPVSLQEESMRRGGAALRPYPAHFRPKMVKERPEGFKPFGTLFYLFTCLPVYLFTCSPDYLPTYSPTPRFPSKQTVNRGRWQLSHRFPQRVYGAAQ
jgi:hypothetical protein